MFGLLSNEMLVSIRSYYMEDRWLSVDDIGIYLGVKRDTVYNWISEKSMPAHKIGRLWKFKKDEIDDWVRKGGVSEGVNGHGGQK
jgi:excisionase family DNA binding protein